METSVAVRPGHELNFLVVAYTYIYVDNNY